MGKQGKGLTSSGLYRYLRVSGMGYKEVAAKVGISRPWLHMRVNGEWKEAAQIVAILKACGMSLETIADIPLGDIFDVEEVGNER